MHTYLIVSALVAVITTARAASTVPGIAALSCNAPRTKHSNALRVIKKHKKTGHQAHLTGKHETIGGSGKNRTISTNSTSSTSSKSNNGLITVVDQACGPTGATLKSSKNSGPNGAREWLNCGISTTDKSSGWTPPTIHIDEVVYQQIDLAKSSVFAPCKDYLSIFDSVAKTTGIPAIFIASIAMQESSCNPNASGDAGDAYGLMQITSDKCGGAPNNDCADPQFNVETGAKYFASQVKTFNGNVLLAMAQYNGWTVGMSYDSATAAANSGCCDCQNNLDYLHCFFNGWIQDIDGNSLVYYNNLAVCGV